jgi:methanogenic corrinoid protein MtbC1
MRDIPARDQLIKNVGDLKEETVRELVQQRIADGENPLDIIDDCQQGLLLVGERYEKGEYFISGLIMAGEIMRQVMKIIQPELKNHVSSCSKGTVILGTVEGDIHDLGKNILNFLLTCRGFTIYDLGVDVAPATFLEQVKEIQPDILGLSGLLTISYRKMKETISLLNEDEYAKDTPVVIGGGQTNAQVARLVGTKLWCNNAVEGVHLCERIITEKKWR